MEDEAQKIYLRNVKMVYKICLLYFKNISEAEDETANVFVAFLDKPVEFTDENHEKAWFITATRNRCRNVLKSAWKSKRGEFPQDVMAQFPESDLEIMEELFKLKEKHRILLYLHYFEGYQTEEIAQMLGINHSTIRTRLVQARKNLKKILEEDGYYEAKIESNF